jgi:CHAD domain-containing protein
VTPEHFADDDSGLPPVAEVAGPDGRRAGTPTPASSAGDVLLAHLRQQVRQIAAQDPPVRRDAPDAVHKMRVASRRLRSALVTFRPVVRAGAARSLEGELKWLAGELGAARDAEVMRDRVRTALAAEGDVRETEQAATIVDAELVAVHRAAHDRVLADLDGERYRTLRAALEGLVTVPPWTELAAAPAGEALLPLVARSYRRLRRIVEEAEDTPEGPEREELLHDARKAAKRTRYAAESVSPVFGADADAFARAISAVQEALGEHQDAVLARDRLRELAGQTPSTDAAFLYGRLYALEQGRAGRSRRHVDTAWEAAGRSSLHRWLRRSAPGAGDDEAVPDPDPAALRPAIPRQHDADEEPTRSR